MSRGNWKTTSELLGSSFLQRQAKAAAKVIADRVQVLRNQRQDARYVDEVESELIQAAKLDLSEAAAAHAAELSKALDSERMRYEADRERHAAAIDVKTRMLERRLEAMSEAELTRYATETARAINSGGLHDVDTVDALSVQLKRSGLADLHLTVREAATAARVNEPWIWTETGARLDDELHMARVAAAAPGTVPVHIDGRWTSVAFDGILEDLEGDHAES